MECNDEVCLSQLAQAPLDDEFWNSQLHEDEEENKENQEPPPPPPERTGIYENDKIYNFKEMFLSEESYITIIQGVSSSG